METPRYWKYEEVKKLPELKTFEEATALAITILKRVSRTERGIVSQICGPITTGGLGSPAANLERFKLAVSVAQRRGILIFDQTLFEPVLERIRKETSNDGYCMDILEVFFGGLLASGSIGRLYMLPGWESSVGATWEYEKALALNIPVFEYNPGWLVDIAA